MMIRAHLTSGCTAAVLGLALLGCDDERCVDRFDVAEWCGNSRCTQARSAADCSPAYCRSIAKSQPLEIPIAQFGSELGSRTELEVTILNAQAGSLALLVALDGVEGHDIRSSRAVVGNRAIRWEPFPSDAQVLEVRYVEGDLATTDLGLEFYDHDCEQENPPEEDPQ